MVILVNISCDLRRKKSNIRVKELTVELLHCKLWNKWILNPGLSPQNRQNRQNPRNCSGLNRSRKW